MNKKVIILSAGGHARSLIPIIESMGYQIEGLVDQNVEKGTLINQYPILGKESSINQYSSEEFILVNGLGYLGRENIRQQFYDQFKQKGYSFLTIISSEAFIGKHVTIAEGAQILHRAIINAHSTIGENTIINTGAIIEHDNHINQHCHIASGAILCGQVTVGEGSFVGAGAVVVHGVNIESNSFIKAASLVKHSN